MQGLRGHSAHKNPDLANYNGLFHGAPAVNNSPVEVLGDETLRTTARELVESVRKNITIGRAEGDINGAGTGKVFMSQLGRMNAATARPQHLVPADQSGLTGHLMGDSRSHMAQRIFNVRVRPPRVCVLISQGACEKDLLLAFEFFSKIWGGRFCQLLVVSPVAPDDLTRFRLAESRPEFVYGIGLEHGRWATEIRQACQPRGFNPLRREFVQSLRPTRTDDYFLVDHALIHLFRVRAQRSSNRQILRLVRTQESTAFLLYCAACFGAHHEHLSLQYVDLETEFVGSTATEFIELATEFVRDRLQSWLDVTGHELNPLYLRTAPRAPTVVLVESVVPDLALFWNLRAASDFTQPASIIPIPFDSANEPDVLIKLKAWLLAFLPPYGPPVELCLVKSQTVEELKCQQFAERFQAILAGTPIERVRYERPRNRLPLIIPFEYETPWSVDITGRMLTIQPPKPKAFENLGSPGAWLVDLLKDVSTGRAVKEFSPPPSPVVFELLNGPCPPRFHRSRIPTVGHGIQSISLRCSGREDVIELYLPSGDEVLEEILREHGLDLIPDEKRSCYLPVVRRFGGLFAAGVAFRGTSGRILDYLKDKPRRLREINSKCQLGSGVLPGKPYLEEVGGWLRSMSERYQRIAMRRFASYAKNQSPEDLKLASVLEFWADRRVLTREWRIGPCAGCRRAFYEPRLDIQRRILCPACGNRIRLSDSVPIGYSLDRTVRLAMREGIAPVVLTGCFLKQMTNSGFFWVPGVKYKLGEKAGDIDILACCDGYLVFCECKQIRSARPGMGIWDDVTSQFLDTARVAKLCGGKLAVLASQVSCYPKDVQDRIEEGIGGSIPYLLLDAQDLERGFRDVHEFQLARSLGFRDLIPEPFPEEKQPAPERTEAVDLGSGIYTSGVTASQDSSENDRGGKTG